jgi:hypothetical protein
MAGNPIIEHYSMPQPQFGGESFDIAGTRIRAQATAAAALLRPSMDVLHPSEHQEGSAVWTGSDWEQISLAVHRLRTKTIGYHYGLLFPALSRTPLPDSRSHRPAKLSWAAPLPSEAHRQIWKRVHLVEIPFDVSQ